MNSSLRSLCHGLRDRPEDENIICWQRSYKYYFPKYNLKIKQYILVFSHTTERKAKPGYQQVREWGDTFIVLSKAPLFYVKNEVLITNHVSIL